MTTQTAKTSEIPPATATALDYGTHPAGPRLTRRQVRRILLALAASPFVLFVLFDVGCGLERRSLLWPWIDTVSAPGYSESSFGKLKAGMTRAEVDRAMGCAPLAIWHADAPLTVPPREGTDLNRGGVVYR